MTTAWLVRLIPDQRHPRVQQDLVDAVKLHHRVMSMLPDDLGPNARHQAGVLYRLEHTRAGARLLVQTRTQPELDRLPAPYHDAHTRELDPLLDTLRPGLTVAYRLAANTCKRLGRHAGPREGKAVALTGPDADQWWTTRAPRCGLRLHTVVSRPIPAHSGWREGTGRLRHAVTQFDGIATIADPTPLREALLGGVGRARSYGCGLLSIAPLTTQP